MIIKYILYLLALIIVIIGFLLLRNIRLESKIRDKQNGFGEVLLKKKKFRLHYVNLVILITLSVGLYRNATPIYLQTVGLTVSGDCAFSLDDDEAIVEWSENVFVAKIDALEEVRKFNILNEDHSPLVDKYRYKINSIYDLIGSSGHSDQLQISRSVEYPGVYVSDLCIQDIDIEVGGVYLIIGGFVDEDTAKSQTDPRNKDGDYYYSYKSILLSGYDTTKSIDEQDQHIQTIISKFQEIVTR